MGDYDSFRYGRAAFPLDDASTNTLLRDADPALFYLLDFLAFNLEEHLGDRIAVEVASASEVAIQEAVSYAVPFDPTRYLKQVQFKFPLLAAYRKSSTFTELSNAFDRETASVDVLYILPPMTGDGMERLGPILNAAKAVIKNAVDVGIHSAYIAPGEATAIASSVWGTSYAGLEKIECRTASFGAFEGTEELYFPALSMTIEMRETVSNYDDNLDAFAGANIHEDLSDNTTNGTVITDVVVTQTNPEPTVTLATPDEGADDGGTAVTLTCTNLVVGAPTTVFFGGEEATNVVVVNATTITCVTPPFTTYGSDETVDIYVVNDGVTATLDDGFTFEA